MPKQYNFYHPFPSVIRGHRGCPRRNKVNVKKSRALTNSFVRAYFILLTDSANRILAFSQKIVSKKLCDPQRSLRLCDSATLRLNHCLPRRNKLKTGYPVRTETETYPPTLSSFLLYIACPYFFTHQNQ